MRGDDGDRGGRKFAGLRTEPDKRLALVRFFRCSLDDLRKEGLQRAIPADHGPQDVHGPGSGCKFVTAHARFLRIRCCT